MAPLPMSSGSWRRTLDNNWRQPDTPQEVLIVEAWSEGVMLGSLMIMAGITLANMRRRVWLHKLILIEVSVDFLETLTSRSLTQHNSWFLL